MDEVVHDARINHDTTKFLAKSINIMGATQMVLGIQSCRDELQRLGHRLRLDLDIKENGGIIVVIKTSDRNGLLFKLLPCRHHFIGEIQTETVLFLDARLHIAIDVHQVKVLDEIDITIISFLSLDRAQCNEKGIIHILRHGDLRRDNIEVIVEVGSKVNLIRGCMIHMLGLQDELSSGFGELRGSKGALREEVAIDAKQSAVAELTDAILAVAGARRAESITTANEVLISLVVQQLQLAMFIVVIALIQQLEKVIIYDGLRDRTSAITMLVVMPKGDGRSVMVHLLG